MPGNKDYGTHVSRKVQEKKTGRKLKQWYDGIPCSLCGVPVKTSQLSVNQIERNIEEAWGLHWTCYLKAQSRLDRESKMANFRQ